MPEKSIQIGHLQPSRLKNFFDKHDERAELMKHFRRKLTYHFAADMNAELFFLLNQQQSHISSLLQIKASFFNIYLVINPTSTTHEEVLQINFASRIQKIILMNTLAIDKTKI